MSENLVVVKTLPIKKIGSSKETGSIYTVLAVGIVILKQDSFCIVKVLDEDGDEMWYKLPDEYTDFVLAALSLSRGVSAQFPCRCEFSRLDGRYSIDILDGVKA